jgi:hypothetical protein
MFLGIQFLKAQQPPVNPQQTPPTENKAQTPPAEPKPQTPAPSPQPANPTPPPSRPTQTSTSAPYIVTGSLDDIPAPRLKRVSEEDTVKFIANSTPIKIVYWNSSAVNGTTDLDTSLNSVRPSVTDNKKQDVILSLNTWLEEGKQYSVPFQITKRNKIEIVRYFDLSAQIKSNNKELYLYFEGVAWKTELKLNGKFLGTNSKPFDTWVIPIQTEWLREHDNLLELTLIKSELSMEKFYPAPFLGIFRPCYLLDSRQLAKLQQPYMTKVQTTSKTVGIFAPYYQEKGFVFDKFEAVRTLIHLKKENINYIYFLFEPSKELKQLCADLGFTQVTKLSENQNVAWLNKYPYSPDDFNFSEQFWVDEHYFRTSHYGMSHRFDSDEIHTEQHDTSILYVLMILFPLLGMFIVKLLNPGFFYAFQEILIRPRWQMDNFIDATLSNQGLQSILFLLKIVIISIFITLMIDYVHLHNQWHIIETLNKNGLFRWWFNDRGALYHYFVKSLIIVGMWAGFRFVLIKMIASPFRVNQMYEKMLNLELMGSYPLLFIMPLPLVFLQFAGYPYHDFLWFMQWLLILIFLTRQIYIYYIGMEKMFKMSNSIRIMYIIVFILLPYIVCL